MTTDDLSTPLGQGKACSRRKALTISWPPVIAALLALPVAVFAGVAMVSNDPFGGEPMAIAPATMSINVAATPEATALAGTPPSGGAPTMQPAAPAPPANTKTVTIIDGTSGTRREVTIPATPDGQGSANDRTTNDQRLTEQSRPMAATSSGKSPVRARPGTK